MRLIDLMVLYASAGMLCAGVVWRRQRRQPRVWVNVLRTLVLWPLWAPFALLDPAIEVNVRSQRIEEQLAQVVAAASGTAFESLLQPSTAMRMRVDLRQAAMRLDELEALLQQPRFDAQAARDHVAALEQQMTNEAAASGQWRSARLHLANIERLQRLHRMQARALGELGQALDALHSQLLVAHYSGTGQTESGVAAIVGDLWARVEGLGEVLECQDDGFGSNVVVLEVERTTQEAC